MNKRLLFLLALAMASMAHNCDTAGPTPNCPDGPTCDVTVNDAGVRQAAYDEGVASCSEAVPCPAVTSNDAEVEKEKLEEDMRGNWRICQLQPSVLLPRHRPQWI